MLRVTPTIAFNSSHLTFCLAYLSGILYGILFEILSGMSSGILSVMSSDILSGKSMADEIRRGSLRSMRSGEEGGGRRRSRASDLKSNNPRLAGGENSLFFHPFLLYVAITLGHQNTEQRLQLQRCQLQASAQFMIGIIRSDQVLLKSCNILLVMSS